MHYIYFSFVYSGSSSGNVELCIKCKRNGNDICIVRSINVIVSRCMRSYWLSHTTKPFASSAIDYGDDATDLSLSDVPAFPAVATAGKYVVKILYFLHSRYLHLSNVFRILHLPRTKNDRLYDCNWNSINSSIF